MIESAQHGDAACQRMLSETGLHLGKALAPVVPVDGPPVIAIGGVLGPAGDMVLDGLRASAEIRNLNALGARTEFCIAEITENATELRALAAVFAEIDMGIKSLSPWMLQPSPPGDPSTIQD